MEEEAQWLALAAALGEVVEGVADFVAEEALHFREIDEVADGADAAGGFEEVADGGAVRVAARERGEVLEFDCAGGLGDAGEDDVGGVEGGRSQETGIRSQGWRTISVLPDS